MKVLRRSRERLCRRSRIEFSESGSRGYFVADHRCGVVCKLHGKPHAPKLPARERAYKRVGVFGKPDYFQNFGYAPLPVRRTLNRDVERAFECLSDGEHRVHAGKLRRKADAPDKLFARIDFSSAEINVARRRKYSEHSLDERSLAATRRAYDRVHCVRLEDCLGVVENGRVGIRHAHCEVSASYHLGKTPKNSVEIIYISYNNCNYEDF